MSLLTANGEGVVAASFSSPISAAWHVDMTVATADVSKVTGSVTLDINDGQLQLKGTARTTGVYLDTARVRLVAGAGGLGTPSKPRYYQQPTVRLVLSDLLATAGETLSTKADAATLGKVLNSWTVTQMPVASAIGLLMAEVSASWRMLADGTCWCGAETWPDVGVDVSIEKQDTAANQLVVSMEAPVLMAGQTVGGFKANYLETQVDAGKVVSHVFIDTGGDRMRDPLASLVTAALPGIDYLGKYRSKVVTQAGNAVDVEPDDPRIPPMTGVPIRHGIPGLEVTLTPPAYVLVGWHNGDPADPYAALWEGGETVIVLKLAGGTLGVARETDPISSATAGPFSVSPQIIQSGSTIVKAG